MVSGVVTHALGFAAVEPDHGETLLGGRERDETMFGLLPVGVDEEGLAPGLAAVAGDPGVDVVVVGPLPTSREPVNHDRSVRKDTHTWEVGPVPPEGLAFLNRRRLTPDAALLAMGEAETMAGAVLQGLEPRHVDAALAVLGKLGKGGVVRGRCDEGLKLRWRLGGVGDDSAQEERGNGEAQRMELLHPPILPCRSPRRAQRSRSGLVSLIEEALAQNPDVAAARQAALPRATADPGTLPRDGFGDLHQRWLESPSLGSMEGSNLATARLTWGLHPPHSGSCT